MCTCTQYQYAIHVCNTLQLCLHVHASIVYIYAIHVHNTGVHVYTLYYLAVQYTGVERTDPQLLVDSKAIPVEHRQVQRTKVFIEPVTTDKHFVQTQMKSTAA